MLRRVEPGRDNTGNRRGRRSREEILDVASRLMAERGYAATTLSALSRESGLPKSAVYHHFRSKGGLLSAVMEHGAYAFFQHMARAQEHPRRAAARGSGSAGTSSAPVRSSSPTRTSCGCT